MLQEKLDIAKQLGAHEVFGRMILVLLKNKEFYWFRVHYSFECVGSEKAMEMAYSLLRRGGTAVPLVYLIRIKSFLFNT